MKSKMVVGFMFNDNETDVLLIEKKKPAWQFNKFNGIGGKCEEGESSEDAMRREFMEETGIEAPHWTYVTTMSGEDWVVDVFSSRSDDVFNAKTMEEERVSLLPVNELDKYDIIENLYWLIPMCLDKLNRGIGYFVYNAQQFASQPPAPVGNVFPDAAEFEDYIGNARDAFVNDVNNQDWNTKMRTASESILICFDQMADRIKQFNKHPVGKMWEEVEVSELPDDWESKVFLYKFDRSPVDTGLFEHMDNGLVKIGGTGRLEYSEIIWLRPVIRTTGMEEALKQIAEMSDPGSPERAIVEMKRIASDALSASTPPKEGWKDRTFTQTEIEHLQSKVHSITGDGEVMMLFNELIGVNAG